MIGTDVWEYSVTPDNGKIVFYERDKYGKEANISVITYDGSNRYQLAEFPQGSPAIYGLLMVLSPTGEKVAFVNHDGIAIINLDGHDFMQLVNLPDRAPTDRTSIRILGWH